MTREEAIEALTSKDVCNSDMMLEALDIAIEALKKQEPTETVSLEAYKQVIGERNIAIQQLEELGYEFGEKIEPSAEHQETVTEFADRCRECGKRYVKRQTGYWIDGWLNEYKSCPIVICSNCGNGGVTAYKAFNYCPNCGCRMVETQESEEYG